MLTRTTRQRRHLPGYKERTFPKGQTTLARVPDGYLSMSEVGRILDVPRPTVTNWVQRGLIPTEVIPTTIEVVRADVIQDLLDRWEREDDEENMTDAPGEHAAQ